VTGVALSAALASGVGAAETAVHVDYRAHDGCPPQQAFLDELHRHGRDVRLLESAASGSRLVVRIDRTGHGSAGAVELRTESNSARSLKRRVEGETCDDVVRALGFVTVMLFDASENATQADVRSEPSERARPASAPSRPEPSPRPSSFGRTPVERPDRTSKRVRERRAVALGMAADVSSVFGATTLGGELFSELPLRTDLLARVSLAYVPDSAKLPIGKANLRWLVGEVSGCWLGLELSARLRLGPCISLAGGEVVATGTLSGGHGHSRTAPWFGAGGSAMLVAYPTRSWLLELGGGATMSLTRHDFVFRDAEAAVPARELPVAGLWGRVGLGVRLP
jgi:hypothetical protein